MHSSTFLPWLLIGPILLAMLAGIGWNLTKWPVLETIAKWSTFTAVGVIVVAMVGAWLGRRELQRARAKTATEPESARQDLGPGDDGAGHRQEDGDHPARRQ